MASSIDLVDLSFGYSGRSLLFENLSCQFNNDGENGKIIALMGPSGVGKSTLCDLVLGTHKPRQGSIRFSPETLRVCVIPQKAVIFEELSIKDNIECLRYSNSLRASFDQEKVEESIESLLLRSVLEHANKSDSLSGGEAQRVMLARIQTVKCDLLVLDEPCSFLDNRVKDVFLSGLRRTVDKMGLLALFVTHVWDEVRAVADEVAFFSQTASGSVSVDMTVVTKAQEAPPTIDAFFGIYWPDCLIVPMNQVFDLTELPQRVVEKGASYIGLYLQQNQTNRYVSDWSERLWRKLLETSDDNLCESLQRIRRYHTLDGMAALCFDKDGVLITDIG